jgi:hypothetical protein
MNMPQWIAQQRLITPPVECHCSCHSTGAMHFTACCEGNCPKCGRFWHNLPKHVAECDPAFALLERIQKDMAWRLSNTGTKIDRSDYENLLTFISKRTGEIKSLSQAGSPPAIPSSSPEAPPRCPGTT